MVAALKPAGTSRDTRRRFEQWAKNPECSANALSALLGVPMSTVAQAEGVPSTMGQSPLALIRGQQFEALLLREDAAGLRGQLEQQGVLPAGSTGLLDLRIRRNRGPMKDLDAAREATVEFLDELAEVRSSADLRATLVAGATVSVPSGAMLPEAILVLDVLAVTFDQAKRKPVLVVGEVKVYPDRGGDTDRTELATARAQSGIYVYGLQQVLAERGLAEAVLVSYRGFLVLTRPGSNQPSVRAREDLEFQVSRAERGLAQLRAIAADMAALHGPRPANPLAVIQSSATCWSERCSSFCDRAPRCRAHAMATGNPAALGDDMARFVGPVDLGRARELIAGASPATDAERDLIVRVQAATAARGAR